MFDVHCTVKHGSRIVVLSVVCAAHDLDSISSVNEETMGYIGWLVIRISSIAIIIKQS